MSAILVDLLSPCLKTEGGTWGEHLTMLSIGMWNPTGGNSLSSALQHLYGPPCPLGLEVWAGLASVC